MLYFAYGSNMDWDQMKSRCPSAKFCGLAVLREHRLMFTSKSMRRNCGVADAVRQQGSHIWGVVYQINEMDVAKLDSKEGYQPGREKNYYTREERHVFLNDKDDLPLLVTVYFAIRQNNPPLPNQEYKDLILRGAKFWHLPEGYVRNTLDIIPVS
jgi:gamma-glutamylcyclotransferase